MTIIFATLTLALSCWIGTEVILLILEFLAFDDEG